jgi:hypothetical protein
MYKKYSCLLYYNDRSKNYLKIFKENKIYFKNIFIYNSNYKKINYPYTDKVFYFKQNFLKTIILNEILKQKCLNLIYSGAPGQIVKEKFLKRIKLFHAHPGKLPQIKGSCAIHYSLLSNRSVHCTIIKLSKSIDDGKIIYIKKFRKPNFNNISYDEFDNKIRAITLIDFIRGKFKKIKIINKQYLLKYYIPHPLIRALNYDNLKKQIFLNIKNIKLTK